MWSQEQVVDSHDERLVRVRQMVQEEVRGGQPQVTDRDVHGAVALFGCSAKRCSVASSNQESKMVSIDGAPLVERSRRRPFCADCGVVGDNSQFHGEQASCGDSLRTGWAALRSSS